MDEAALKKRIDDYLTAFSFSEQKRADALDIAGILGDVESGAQVLGKGVDKLYEAQAIAESFSPEEKEFAMRLIYSEAKPGEKQEAVAAASFIAEQAFHQQGLRILQEFRSSAKAPVVTAALNREIHEVSISYVLSHPKLSFPSARVDWLKREVAHPAKDAILKTAVEGRIRHMLWVRSVSSSGAGSKKLIEIPKRFREHAPSYQNHEQIRWA